MSSNHQNRWLNYGIIAAIALLIGAGFYALSQRFESVMLSVNKGYTLEAYRNPFLAAQQFLEKHQIPSQNAVDITEAMDQLQADDTLLLLNTRIVPEPYQQPLMDWVASGGHLIITVHNLWDEDYGDSGDTFLDGLGVRMEGVIEDEVERLGEAAGEFLEQNTEDNSDAIDDIINEAIEEVDIEGIDEIINDSTKDSANDTTQNTGEEKTTQANQCQSYGYTRVSTLTYDKDLPPIQVQFGNYVHLYDASGNAYSTGNNYPNHVLQYPIGDGMITTVSNHHIWKNDNIGWYDHAFLLWLLINDPSTVWFVFDKESDSLLSLILDHLLELFVSALLLLVLYLWYRAKRFGPILPEPEQGRRSLLEHLVADAKFNWKHQQLDSFVRKQREDIKTHYEHRHGGHHDPAIIFSTLAKQADLTEQEVEWALTTAVPYNAQDYTQLIRRLQRLRNAV